jgi:hypothetical protein
MKVLELFKGTGSVGKCIKDFFPDSEIVSLDILKKYQPTHCCDILDFDYKQYPVGHFDIIWASPECKIYSLLQNTHIGKKWKDKGELEEARDKNSCYVKKVLEIIEYFQPKRWYIENPYNSAMKNIECMKKLPSFRFDYCRFGYIYQKPTRIWTNRTDLTHTICECTDKHAFKIGINSKKLTKEGQEKCATSLNERYSIPQPLMKILLCEGI